MFRQSALKTCSAVIGLVAVLGGSSVAVAQTRTINPSNRFTVSVQSISSTRAVQPQIQPSPPFVLPEIAAENEYTPPLPPEPPNNLFAGGMLVSPRGLTKAYFPGPTDGRYVPPDCNMAVGPNNVVVVINATIAFYDKNGSKQFQSPLDGSNGFFTGTAQTTFVFDPKCMYDPISQRFIVLADDLDTGSSISNVLLAVSATNNPNGTWFKYRIPAAMTSGGSGYWLDYPGFGYNKDAVVITGNMFGFSSGYLGAQGLVVKKAPLLTGGAAQVTSLIDPGIGTLMPSRTTDSTVDKVWGIATGGGNAMRFYAFVNLATTPLLKEIDVPVPAYNRPGGPAQSGSNQIDALDGRTMTVQYRKGQVVCANTESLNSGGLGIRWYDFNVNTWPASGAPSVKQSGDVSQNNVGLHMPSININSFEDISIFYTRSSQTIAADLCISARYKTDPAGQMGQPVKLIGSQSANYQSFRWGDYFGNEIDPADDTTFWGFGMTIDAGGAYQTQILKWVVTPVNGATGTPIGADSVSTYLGNTIFGDTTSIAAADGVTYQVGSASVPQFGQAAGVEADFTVPTNSTRIAVNFTATSGAVGGTTMVWAYNWSTHHYDLIGSVPTPAFGSATQFVNVLQSNVPKYMDSGGHVKIEFRGHFPIKPITGALPTPFTYQIDLLQLVVR